MVLVTHSIAEAVFLGQSILVLSRHPGPSLALLPNAAMGDRRSPRTHEIAVAVVTP